MDLKQALFQRGHKITSQGTLEDILIPDTEDRIILESFQNILYNFMSKKNFRKNLRDFTFKRKVEPRWKKIIDSYLVLARSFDKKLELSQKRYSNTFEWYISELLVRKFGVKVSGFSLRLKDAHPDDEFDCIAVFEEGLFFAECKTGKSDLKNEIKKFIRRDKELCAKYSLFVLDRDYLFKRGEEDFPGFTKREAYSHGIDQIYKVKGQGYDLRFFETEQDRSFFACSAFDKLEGNIRHLIRCYNRMYDSDFLFPGCYKRTRIPFSDEIGIKKNNSKKP